MDAPVAFRMARAKCRASSGRRASAWVQQRVLGSDPSTFVWRAQRVLVVSPHPDDDVLGCGGTLARAQAAGAALRVVYVTDGSASHIGSDAFPPARLRDVREREAAAALAVLGIPASMLRFMRESDGRLASAGPAAEELAQRIAEHVRDFAPTIVFSPWIRDVHSDHVATSLAVRRTLARNASAATLYEYAVWPGAPGSADDAPRPGEVEVALVDVRSFRAGKARAIREHRSQLGGVVHDAAQAFVLPASLLERSDVDAERFFRITVANVARS